MPLKFWREHRAVVQLGVQVDGYRDRHSDQPQHDHGPNQPPWHELELLPEPQPPLPLPPESDEPLPFAPGTIHALWILRHLLSSLPFCRSLCISRSHLINSSQGVGALAPTLKTREIGL